MGCWAVETELLMQVWLVVGVVKRWMWNRVGDSGSVAVVECQG